MLKCLDCNKAMIISRTAQGTGINHETLEEEQRTYTIFSCPDCGKEIPVRQYEEENGE